MQEQKVTTKTKYKIIVCNVVPFKQFNRPGQALRVPVIKQEEG
jgi:hypothetical protein